MPKSPGAPRLPKAKITPLITPQTTTEQDASAAAKVRAGKGVRTGGGAAPISASTPKVG